MIASHAMSRNIIICCDGTGNKYEENKTNVVRTAEIAVKSEQQLVYYDPGVGTGGFGYGMMKRITSQGSGGGLQQNVEDAYRFLMKTYGPEDRIYLFGFSRGAFTARSLAGMLYRIGLLRTNLDNLVKYASEVYNREGDNLDQGFKETFCRPCRTHFIGVWDTVESLAFNEGKRFHDHKLNPETSHAYHAISIDEKRSKFPPTLWDESRPTPQQDMQQVWFAGVHSDIGGWYKDRGLSDIALEWMLRNAQGKGMQLSNHKMQQLQPDPLGKQHDSHKGVFWTAMGTHERQVPPKAKVHSSVRTRLQNTDYKPPKELPPDIQWVDTPTAKDK